MKNFIIIILLGALVAENIYIYNNPETVCQDMKEKMDSWRTRGKAEAISWMVDEDVEIVSEEE
jgi:hypothetical protein